MKPVIGYDSADKTKSASLTQEQFVSIMLKLFESVHPNEEWKKFSLLLEFEAKEDQDALHLSGIVLRNSSAADKLKESGRTSEAKDGLLAVDFMNELKSLE